MTAQNQKAGFFYSPESGSFCSVWAPLAKKVVLEIVSPGSFEIELSKNNYGYWQASIPSAMPGMQYYFRVDDKKQLPDPASLSQPSGVHGPSELIDRSAFSWTDHHWLGMELKDMIIYELHSGTFSAEGTFEGIIKKLDYLVDLGINTIELMPVGQFPGERNWGYDGVFVFAVQHSYGGADELKALIDAAHQKGIAVILDVIYNHLGPEGNYLPEFGPYNTEKYFTPWAKAMNFDDAYSDGVREYYLQNALMWLDEFHIDGLRLDAVHAIWDSGATHFLEILHQRVKELERKTGKKKVLIAEFDLNNPRYINPVELGGYGMDGQWIDEFHHALHALITGETNGYYSDFGAIEDLEKSFRDSYVFTGQYSNHRKKHFGKKPSNDYGQFVVFAQNHDHTGNRMKGERLTTIMKNLLETADKNDEEKKSLVFESLKLIAATYILSPYVPMLFMGEEYGEERPFLFFTDHSDKDLIANTSKGRKKEFESFAWKEDPPEPNDISTFNTCKLSWNINESNAKLLEWYKYLIKLRKTHPALQSVVREDMIVHPAKGKILAIERRGKGSSVYIMFNFSGSEEQFAHPGLKGNIIVDSSSAKWSTNENEDENNIQEKLVLKPFSAVIIENK